MVDVSLSGIRPATAAARLGVSLSTIKRMVADGRLHVVRVGRSVIVPELELLRVLAR